MDSLLKMHNIRKIKSTMMYNNHFIIGYLEIVLHYLSLLQISSFDFLLRPSPLYQKHMKTGSSKKLLKVSVVINITCTKLAGY